MACVDTSKTPYDSVIFNYSINTDCQTKYMFLSLFTVSRMLLKKAAPNLNSVKFYRIRSRYLIHRCTKWTWIITLSFTHRTYLITWKRKFLNVLILINFLNAYSNVVFILKIPMMYHWCLFVGYFRRISQISIDEEEKKLRIGDKPT